mmetsp:Transcript_65307/g.181598  ORF Transcript_65307/g.181598 Transcript_65307/m.181598 type:complete len:104 (+) Transcript_65307:618-929(+)
MRPTRSGRTCSVWAPRSPEEAMHLQQRQRRWAGSRWLDNLTQFQRHVVCPTTQVRCVVCDARRPKPASLAWEPCADVYCIAPGCRSLFALSMHALVCFPVAFF